VSPAATLYVAGAADATDIAAALTGMASGFVAARAAAVNATRMFLPSSDGVALGLSRRRSTDCTGPVTLRLIAMEPASTIGIVLKSPRASRPWSNRPGSRGSVGPEP
jgi:hypothetical protein